MRHAEIDEMVALVGGLAKGREQFKSMYLGQACHLSIEYCPGCDGRVVCGVNKKNRGS